MKLALGTVQFGLSYGVANKTGQVERATIAAILNRARLAGINTMDTAISYGESEASLGATGVRDWRIITKLPGLSESCTNVASWVKDQVMSSLARLNVPRLKGLLLHRPEQLIDSKSKKALWTTLQGLRKDGIVEKIGFSIYDPTELDTLWSFYQPDLVQAPYNIFDRRLAMSGWLQRMVEAGVEVHVRSVFLQGLLLMSENDRPKKFRRWSTLWADWHAWLQEQELTALQACLSFAMADQRISRIIVGVDNVHQLEEILSSTDKKIKEFPDYLCTKDLDLISPSRWGILCK